jgi:integrase
MLFLPDSKTGRKAVVLPQPAIAVVEALPRAGKYVIMGERPDRPRSDLKRPWEVIRRRAGLEDVRLHDLRHSFASVGVAGNFGLPVIGKLLGQKRAETTNRYAHLAIAPLKSAADTIAGILATEMGEGTATLKQGAQVIELPRG